MLRHFLIVALATQATTAIAGSSKAGSKAAGSASSSRLAWLKDHELMRKNAARKSKAHKYAPGGENPHCVRPGLRQDPVLCDHTVVLATQPIEIKIPILDFSWDLGF